jgi:hypothetical protein
MKKAIWGAIFVAIGACGAMSWLVVQEACRPCVVACMPHQAPASSGDVADDEARMRVLQLLDTQALSPAPVIRNPNSADSAADRVPSAEEIVAECVVQAEYRYGCPLEMPYAQDEAPTFMPPADECAASDDSRFDLWMLLMPVSENPASTDAGVAPRHRAGSKPRLRTIGPRPCEDCPAHPEVDTLEFRPSDSKKGEYEAYHRRPL